MGNKQQAPTGVVIECKVQGGYVEMPDGSSEWTNNRNWRTEVISEIYLEPGTLLYTTPPAAPVQQKPLFEDIIAQHPGLTEALKAMDAAPVQPVAIPLENSEVASLAIQAMLAEYQFPSNPTNAARAGWRAARLYLPTAQPAPEKGQP
jgi:hypothetical protein